MVLAPLFVIDTILWQNDANPNDPNDNEDAHNDTEQIFGAVSFIFYILPYSTNFLIYVARNTQYQEAFFHFLYIWKKAIF